MDQNTLAAMLRSYKEFFDRSTSCLEEEDSGFAPVEGMMTAAQHVAHVAHTVDWFFEGAFRPGGFGMDFEKYAAEIARVTSLAEARSAFEAQKTHQGVQGRPA